MTHRCPISTRTAAQRGAVLVVGLIFLALMTLIGVTAFSVTTQQERMAGNARDRTRALEAAEMALRHCERVMSQPTPPTFSATGGAGGFYTEPALAMPEKWQTLNWHTDSTHQLAGVAGVAEQPRCIVQRLSTVTTANASLRAELPQGSSYAYQVTARGVGANRNTAVVLQSTFIRD